MAATISSSGTWTTLTFGTRDALKDGDNRPRLNDIFFEQLALVDLDELNQFIDLVAAGYGIAHQSALVLLLSVMKAKLGREQENPSMVNTVGAVGG